MKLDLHKIAKRLLARFFKPKTDAERAMAWIGDRVFISNGWTGNSRMLWAKGGKGYTAYIYDAELFTIEDAEKLLRSCPGKYEIIRPSLENIKTVTSFA